MAAICVVSGRHKRMYLRHVRDCICVWLLVPLPRCYHPTHAERFSDFSRVAHASVIALGLFAVALLYASPTVTQKQDAICFYFLFLVLRAPSTYSGMLAHSVGFP